MISKLQYISQEVGTHSHSEMVHRALDAGVDWVQLRIKDKSPEFILEEAHKCAELCKTYMATFIVNDNPLIAKNVGADGVHLGKNDVHVSEARIILGEDAIIGGTCNTYEDIVERINEGVNYIGLGPFRYTFTKDNLSPVLGTSGYEQIVSKLNGKLPIPIIAIGGIVQSDIPELIKTGVHGVAVASLINKAKDAKAMVKTLKKSL